MRMLFEIITTDDPRGADGETDTEGLFFALRNRITGAEYKMFDGVTVTQVHDRSEWLTGGIPARFRD